MPFESDPTASFQRIELCDEPRCFVSERRWRWTTRIPDYCNLWIALRGTGAMRVDGVDYGLAPGTAFVLAPGQRIDAEHDPADPIHNMALHFHALNTGGKRVHPPEFPLLGVKVGDSVLVEAVARVLTRAGFGPESFRSSRLNAWGYALVLQVMQDARQPRPDPVDARILRIAERIAADPGRMMSVGELAEEAGLSRTHFTRRFTRVTGESPKQYGLRHRAERAAYLIEHSPLTLADIAESLGYSDVYFFGRQFKALKGFTPGSLRRPSGRQVKRQ